MSAKRSEQRILLCVIFLFCFLLSGRVFSVPGDTVLQHLPYEPLDSTTPKPAAPQWQLLGEGLHADFVTTDKRFDQHIVPPVQPAKTHSAVAWRNERINAQVLLFAKQDITQIRIVPGELTSKGGGTLPASAIKPCFVRYTRGDKKNHADILDTSERMDLAAASVRPVWIQIDVPAAATPETYRGPITILAENLDPISLNLEIEVLSAALPAPKDWGFHLDLWQNPYSVARYHRVRPWSPEHVALLKPYLTMLAEAGQKCVTTSIVFEPWGGQTFDPFDTMIEWTKKPDGSWEYDYTIFDQWVSLCMAQGIDKQINCYSMIPWSNRFRYLDAATGNYEFITAEPGSDVYEDHWRPFLKSFRKHLRQKGWLDKTAIAMDERKPKVMQKLFAFLEKAAPELKVASAVNYPTKATEQVYDLSIAIQYTAKSDLSLLAARAAQKMPITYYVCCEPLRPNTFVNSPPAESVWLGWNAAANGFSGLLRWAYISWVEDPLQDTRYVRWPASDCFLIYPGPRSSIRFERMREGIQDFEKVQIVKAALQKRGPKGQTQLNALDAVLKRFNYEKLGDDAAIAKDVADARGVLEQLSRQISE